MDGHHGATDALPDERAADEGPDAHGDEEVRVVVRRELGSHIAYDHRILPTEQHAGDRGTELREAMLADHAAAAVGIFVPDGDAVTVRVDIGVVAAGGA